MNSLDDKLASIEEEEWQVISSDWWRISFNSVSWSYSQFKNPCLKRVVAKPPHYHDALFNGTRRFACSAPAAPVTGGSTVSESGELSLNPELGGVWGADDAMLSYETYVGFYAGGEIRDKDLESHRALQASNADEVILSTTKARWDEFVSDITGGVHLSRMLRIRESVAKMARRFPPGNAPANHQTPREAGGPIEPSSGSSFSTLRLHETPGRKDAPLNKSLNRSASTFVPLTSVTPPSDRISFPTLDPSPTCSVPFERDTPSPTFSSFTFPTLDVPPLPNVKIKKDEQGFYTEVSEKPSSSQRASSALLPPFLQDATHRRRAPASRTRAIVDRLRSGTHILDGDTEQSLDARTTKSHAPSPSPTFHDTSFFRPRLSQSEDGGDQNSGFSTPSQEDEEGWIGVGESEFNAQESKARRTRDLCLALTRRRTDSTTSSTPAKAPSRLRDNSVDLDASSSSLSSSPSPKSPLSDGWIEGSSASPSFCNEPSPSRAHSRPASSRGSKSSQGSTHMHIPPTPVAMSFAGGMGYPVQMVPAPNYVPQSNPAYFYQTYPTTMVPMPFPQMQGPFQYGGTPNSAVAAGGFQRKWQGPYSNPGFLHAPVQLVGMPFMKMPPMVNMPMNVNVVHPSGQRQW